MSEHLILSMRMLNSTVIEDMGIRVKRLRCLPFSYLVSEDWHLCYAKIQEIACLQEEDGELEPGKISGDKAG